MWFVHYTRDTPDRDKAASGLFSSCTINIFVFWVTYLRYRGTMMGEVFFTVTLAYFNLRVVWKFHFGWMYFWTDWILWTAFMSEMPPYRAYSQSCSSVTLPNRFHCIITHWLNELSQWFPTCDSRSVFWGVTTFFFNIIKLELHSEIHIRKPLAC